MINNNKFNLNVKESKALEILNGSDIKNSIKFSIIKDQLELKKSRTHEILKGLIIKGLIKRARKGSYYITPRGDDSNIPEEDRIINHVKIKNDSLEKFSLIFGFIILTFSIILIFTFKFLFSDPLLMYLTFFSFIIIFATAKLVTDKLSAKDALKINYNDFFTEATYIFSINRVMELFIEILDFENNQAEETFDKIQNEKIKSYLVSLFIINMIGLIFGFLTMIINNIFLFGITIIVFVIIIMVSLSTSKTREEYYFHYLLNKDILSKWKRLSLLINSSINEKILTNVPYQKKVEKTSEIKKRLKALKDIFFKWNIILGYIELSIGFTLLVFIFTPFVIFTSEAILFLPFIAILSFIITESFVFKMPNEYKNYERHVNLIEIHLRCIRYYQRELMGSSIRND